MKLQQLIDELKRHPPEKVVLHGFKDARSYRGSYDRVAFKPASNTTVGKMLEEAEYAVGWCEKGQVGRWGRSAVSLRHERAGAGERLLSPAPWGQRKEEII